MIRNPPKVVINIPNMVQLQTNGSPACPPCVALVDDEVQITQALHTLLSLQDVPTSVHHSAESLLQAVQMEDGQLRVRLDDGTPATIQAVVLDLHLPGMNGIDLVVALRRLQPGLRLVMITAATESTLQTRKAELQGVTLLTKPFDLESLEAALFPTDHAG